MNVIEAVEKSKNRPWLIMPYFYRIFNKHTDDEKYIKTMYRLRNKKELNLDNPTTYMEKINWIKLHDRRPIYTTMVDKYEVKKYVDDMLGPGYTIPSIGVWDTVDEIDFDELPQRFVLKCTHDSGSTVICRDKSKLDINGGVKKHLKKCLQTDYYSIHREWPYKNVKRRIMCEEYIEGIVDKNYKIFCFDGVVKFLYVAPYRESTADYFDADFKHLDGISNIFHSGAEVPPEKPGTFDEMKRLAEKLSKGYPEMRIDFYDDHGKIYFGEITLFQEGGFAPYYPDKWNYIFGEYIDLTPLMKN